MKNHTNVSIRNGMSKTQLYTKIYEFYKNFDVLIIDVSKNNNLKIVEFDGICVTVWFCNNAYDFLEGLEYPQIVEIL